MISVDIINKLISSYTCSTTNIQAGSIAIGEELFNTFAVISIAWLGLNHLLRKNVDMVDVNIDLIKWLMYLNFFYLFIVHYQDIYNVAFGAIQEIGNSLGAKASGSPVDINPGSIINLGFQICKELLTRLITFNLFRSFAIAIVTLLAAVVVMYCFVVIAIDLILIQIGSKIILAGGIFLLAFSALQWTREYAERYVHTFFHLGIKMIFMYILVGIGAGLARDWAQLLDTAPMNQLIESEIAVMVCAFIYYKLCEKLPDHAASYLTGRLSMSYETASSLSSSVKGVLSVPKKTYEVVKHTYDGYKKAKEFSSGVAAGMQGDAKARDTASQAARADLETQGKTPNPQDIQREAIKTLGEAQRQVKQAEWDKKVDDTFGGKTAQMIIGKKPRTVPSIQE